MPSPQHADQTVRHAIAQPRIAIEAVQPIIEGGRFASKCLSGRPLPVSAVIFSDGHEQLAADLLWRAGGEATWQRKPMQALGNDHWSAELRIDQQGRGEFAIEAWLDVYASFRQELVKKLGAGVPVELELQEGAQLVRRIAAQAPEPLRAELTALIERMEASQSQSEREAVLIDPSVNELMRRAEYRPHLLRTPNYPLDVERSLAEFASWYELFPRSLGDEQRHGTFADVHARIPEIARMGFDVLYFPPIHPIGRAHRKGPNNSLKAGPGDPGSHTPSAARRAVMRPCTHSSAASRIFANWYKWPANMAWKWRWILPCSARPITPGSSSTPVGSAGARTAAFAMQRTRQRSTRTSSTSSSMPKTPCRICGWRCAMWYWAGWSRA